MPLFSSLSIFPFKPLKRTYQTSGIRTRLAVFCTILQELFNEVVNVYHKISIAGRLFSNKLR